MMEPKIAGLESSEKSVLQMFPLFPTVFLMFTVAMFVMPIYLVLYVGEDPSTQQWFPHVTHIVVVLPIYYVLTFLVHMGKGAPSRMFITVSLIGSCLTLLIISNFILMEAAQMAPMFASASDCLSWAPKREMQAEWELARTYYATCMNDMAKKENVTFAAAVSDYRIQNCPNYSTAVGLHPSWEYLEHLESTQFCGGWCKSAPAMWTRDHVQDACSPVVAEILNDKVIWCLKQVCFYTVFSLAVLSVFLIYIPQVLQTYKIDWYSL
jgi:hypothetical protein